MACRDMKRSEEARKRILDRCEPSAAERLHGNNIATMDLKDNASIENFVSRLTEQFPVIDLVVCNAGVVVPLGKQSREQRYECMFQTMVLGHYLLVELLLPNITRKGQVIVVASNAQYFVHKDMDRLPLSSLARMDEFVNTSTFRSLVGMGYQYGHVKLMTIWLTLAWHRRYHDSTGIRFNCLHPGAIKSTITTKYLFEFQKPFAYAVTKLLFSPTWQGAETTLHVAMTKDVSGHFFQMAAKRDNLLSKRANNVQKQDELLEFLWEEVGPIIQRNRGADNIGQKVGVYSSTKELGQAIAIGD